MTWNEDWAAEALCNQTRPDELFVRGAAQNRAKQMCAGCPVRDDRCEKVAVIWVIDAVVAVGAEIGNLIPFLDQPPVQSRLKVDGSVIGSDGNAHVSAHKLRRRFPPPLSRTTVGRREPEGDYPPLAANASPNAF